MRPSQNHGDEYLCKYPAYLGWQDPFELVRQWNQNRNENDPPIVAVISQATVSPLRSGAQTPVKDKASIIEGVNSRGDGFMVGQKGPEDLPKEVVAQVRRVYQGYF